MFLHIALVAEVLATIVCIHCIYGKKVECDVRTVTAFLGIFIILESINIYHWNAICSMSGYVIIVIYCRNKFGSTVAEAILSTLLCILLSTTIQFICISIVNIVIQDQQLIRNAVSNVVAFAICIVVLPQCGINRLRRCMFKGGRYVWLVLGFLLLVVWILLLQEKVFFVIHAQYFIFVMPAIILALGLIIKWYTVQMSVERMEEEIHNTEKNVKVADELLIKVRLRQHEFRNHIAAILSAHYTYKSYDKLVQAQEEYCTKLLKENKYNNLLVLENNVLIGFLYTKFQEVEAEAIILDYMISAKVKNSRVPTYYIIEMLGILFDNAMEALQISDEKIIYFEVKETKEEYQFLLKNPFKYVSYDEISEWFQYEKGEKGSGRGLGLFHLKCLCEEWRCEIGCRNEKNGQQNWIVFSLKMEKADNE